MSPYKTFVPSMLDRGHHLTLRGAVARQLVRNHHTRHAGLALQQLPEQAFGGRLVPPALDESVEHDPILVHRAPEPVLLAGNLHLNLVQAPLVSGTGEPAPDLVGKRLAELARPLPDRLVADADAAGRQKLIHHAQAQREAEVEPDRVADDLGRKAIAGVAGAGGRCHLVRLPSLVPHRKPASSQVDGAVSPVSKRSVKPSAVITYPLAGAKSSVQAVT